MESLHHALGHSVAIAARIGYKLFRRAVFNTLFIISEDDLPLAIELDVDLLGIFMLYAPQAVKTGRQMIARIGRGYEHKITLESSLKFLKEECDSRGNRHYYMIVNLPEGQEHPEGVFPPPGADPQGVAWYWNNIQRLKSFLFEGKVPAHTKKWGVEHLKWRKEQYDQGKTGISDLIEASREGREDEKKHAEGTQETG